MRDKHETDGSITKIQLRHLTSSVAENYALFCSEYPDLKVGRTKFHELRPSHVLLSSKLPHNVCLCREHEHFIAQQDSLHKACSEFPPYSHDLPVTFICQPPTVPCWMNNCDTCRCGGLQECVKLLPNSITLNNRGTFIIVTRVTKKHVTRVTPD